jgi:hypothetical protein
MSDEPESREPWRRLEAIRAALALCAGDPASDPAEFEHLADEARALMQSDDPELSAAAQRLELRALGALLACQANVLRRLAHELQMAARLLPPPRPELN